MTHSDDRPTTFSAAGEIEARRQALHRHALPISTVDPAAQNDDFAWLAALSEGLQILGAGEATHGTSEFFKLKSRIFKELVMKHGFTVFAMETPFNDGYAMDQYVTGQGPDNVHSLMDDFYFFVWKNEEVRELLEWMRAYNQKSAPDRKIRVIGIDLQNPAGNIELIKKLMPENECLRKALDELTGMNDRDWNERVIGSLLERTTLMELLGELQSLAVQLPEETPERPLILYICRNIIQWYVSYAQHSDNKACDLRDEGMAENTLYLMKEFLPGQKAMLWAHNSHVSKQADETQEFTPLGQHLQTELGSAYKTIGFSMIDGEVYARGIGEAIREPHVQAVEPAPTDSLDALLSASAPALCLDVLRAAQDPVLKDWFAQPIRIHAIGAFYDRGRQYDEYVLPNCFDVLISVKDTHAAQPLK